MFGKGVSPAQLHLLFSFSLLRAPCLACSRPASAFYWEYHRRHRSCESSPARETNSRSNRAMSELGQKRKCWRFSVMSALPHKADINCRDCGVRFVPSAAIREPHSIIYFSSARGAGPDHLLVRSNASAGALCRLQSNRMLRCRAQLVEDHRLGIERALIDESGAQARLIDQPPEQVEIGIRRQHDVNAAARLEALVGLFKQGCQVPILRAGMPAAVGEIAGLARMLWRT